jgi:predicted secreted hydrolase
MDHEFSTRALSDGQIGWDWFSVQLDDRSELMLFQIRREDGSIDPFSSGTWIAADGSTSKLDLEDFQISVQDTWRSPHTGATYPAKWKISVPSKNLSLELVPLLQDQELQVSYNYWEGAVNVQGSINGEPISGKGYIELTGYAGSMAGQF